MNSFLRPLSQQEHRVLEGALAFRQRQFRRMGRSISIFALVMLGALLALTALARNVPRQVVILAWIAGGVILFWSYVDARRDIVPALQRVESALRRNQARVLRIQASEMVELEEEEDEVATYAFQLVDGHIVFIAGQDFYPSARFPNSDFSIVDILAEDGSIAEGLIAKHGRKLKPTRTIPAQVKSRLNVPDHLETVRGKLEDLDRLLST